MVRICSVLLIFLLATCAAAQAGDNQPAAAPPASITVQMEPCKASRPASITSLLAALAGGARSEELIKRGTLEVDGEKCTLYLPKAKAYSTKNTKKDDGEFENTSTLLSVDQKGTGKLTRHDGWFANLPLRLGDKMFEIAEIATDGSRIVLRPSKAPLRGLIVGRKCPPFSFKTADGKEYNLDRLAGKPFLLDIWSIT
jgi:hypothetical protein